MFRRYSHIVFVVSLVFGLSGIAPVAVAAIAAVSDTHADCCTDCDEPNCPDEDGEGCPPRCGDCVCPTAIVPVIAVSVQLAITAPSLLKSAQFATTYPHQSPPPSGVFRPPRLSA